MANITLVGRLGSTGVSSGPHLHQYVKNLLTGEYEDPGMHPSKFLGVRLGPNRVPKYITDDKGGLILNPASGLTMTSDWGPRDTGIEKASTYHRGRDYGGKEGTEVFVEGDIQFLPKPNQGGYGNVASWLTPDKKYELGYAHMQSLGEASDLSKASNTANTTSTTSANDLLAGVLLGIGLNKNKQESTETQLKRQLIGQLTQPQQSQNFLSDFVLSNLMGRNPYLPG